MNKTCFNKKYCIAYNPKTLVVMHGIIEILYSSISIKDVVQTEIFDLSFLPIGTQ